MAGFVSIMGSVSRLVESEPNDLPERKDDCQFAKKIVGPDRAQKKRRAKSEKFSKSSHTGDCPVTKNETPQFYYKKNQKIKIHLLEKSILIRRYSLAVFETERQHCKEARSIAEIGVPLPPPSL